MLNLPLFFTSFGSESLLIELLLESIGRLVCDVLLSDRLKIDDNDVDFFGDAVVLLAGSSSLSVRTNRALVLSVIIIGFYNSIVGFIRRV